MRRRMVAIISLMLILVTTISYIAPEKALAENDTLVRVPEFSSTSCIVMSGSTSEVVFERHSTRKMQPGKITMLMTAMVLLDNLYNEDELNNTVEIGDIIASYGDMFSQGETVSVDDLLTAMLVGGDVQAAEALAKYGAKSREVFVNEMNAKCMELGLMDTQFANAGGRYDTDQYSTAADLAVITQAALRYQKIKDLLKVTDATISASLNKESRNIGIKTSDPLLSGEGGVTYEYITGGIMGNMEAPVNAAQFASAAVKDDMQMICILMDSKPDTAAAEAKALLEYGDKKVTKNTIVKKGKLAGHARVRNGASTRVAGYTETKGYAYVPPEGSDALIRTEVVMMKDLEAPLKKGDKAGEFRIYVADELKGTVDLVIKKDVPVGWPPSRFYISNKATVAIAVLLTMILAFFIRVQTVKHQRRKRREAMRKAKIREIAMQQLEIEEDRKRRNWDGRGYDYRYETPMPRTSDLRKTSIERGLRDRNEDV